MSLLGIPYRVVYEAREHATGLSNISCRVIKPNGAIVGDFTLTEFANAAFKGFYYFDLITQDTDPEGEWIAIINSASESIRAPWRISFQKDRTAEIQSDLGEALHGFLGPDVLGEVSGTDEIIGVIYLSEDLTAHVGYCDDEIDGEVSDSDEIIGYLTDNSIALVGYVEEC